MRQIVINLFLGFVGLCGIIGVIGCENFEALIGEIIEPEPIQPPDNEWVDSSEEIIAILNCHLNTFTARQAVALIRVTESMAVFVGSSFALRVIGDPFL